MLKRLTETYLKQYLSFFQPTFLHLAPPVVSFLANSEKVKPEHLGSIKSIFVAAAPFGEAVAQKFLEKAPHVVFREGRFEI